MSDGINERDLFGEIVRPDPRGILKDKFIMPPFSVLNAREGDWQERKRKWLALGIKSELGRGDVMPAGANSVYSGSSQWGGARGGQRSGVGVGCTMTNASARAMQLAGGFSRRHGADE